MENSVKANGRPELKEGKRSRFINVRFSEEEMILVDKLEKTLGISRTDLIRMRLLDEAGTVVVNAVELIKHLDLTGAELARIGNNINQMARHANTLKLKGDLPPEIAGEFNGLFEDYIVVLRNVEIALRKIIRAMAG